MSFAITKKTTAVVRLLAGRQLFCTAAVVIEMQEDVFAANLLC